jgi:hypothetical protein
MTAQRNRTQQNETSLSRSQETALRSLLSGETITAAAKAAKVNRSTAHRWLHDPEFLANLNRRRSELRDAQRDHLARLASSALEVVEEALSEGDVRSALTVLRGVGLLPGQAPDKGPTTADRVRVDQAKQQKSLELDQLFAELT